LSRNIYKRSQKPSGRTQSGPKGPVYGAIDLGTNNCRLLLAEPTDNGFHVIDGFSRVVRLGEGVSKTGRLSDAAMKRTLAALKICADKAKRLNAKKIRCIATEACRRASNGDDFLKTVNVQTGLFFETITPELEAELTLSGCSPLLNTGHERALLFDIGGGSTEVMWVETPRGSIPKAKGIISFPMGVVTLAEDYGDVGLDPVLYEKIRTRVSDKIDPFCEQHDIRSAIESDSVQMLGTSGTVTTLGAIYLGLNRYDRSRVDGLTIPFKNIRAISARLACMEMETRRNIPCIGADRADLMLMGCAILGAICERWPLKTLRAADRGIREGLLLGLINQDRQPNPNNRDHDGVKASVG
jgi:exopolyphosphatase/guanosine-5'-triphosphate,3'-diphosphate pyrophosphatase